MAMHAHPVPIDPYTPVSQANSDDNEVIRHPSPFVPIRLPIFTVVVLINDFIVRILSVGGGSGSKGVTLRSRAISDPTERVEEGEGMELKSMRRPSKPSQVGDRLNIGRRKAD